MTRTEFKKVMRHIRDEHDILEKLWGIGFDIEVLQGWLLDYSLDYVASQFKDTKYAIQLLSQVVFEADWGRDKSVCFIEEETDTVLDMSDLDILFDTLNNKYVLV